MNIVFRTDASVEIGTGHVMRCLTLANALQERKAHCHFICREHAGHLIDLIKSQGFAVTVYWQEVLGSEKDRLILSRWMYVPLYLL